MMRSDRQGGEDDTTNTATSASSPTAPSSSSPASSTRPIHVGDTTSTPNDDAPLRSPPSPSPASSSKSKSRLTKQQQQQQQQQSQQSQQQSPRQSPSPSPPPAQQGSSRDRKSPSPNSKRPASNEPRSEPSPKASRVSNTSSPRRTSAAGAAPSNTPSPQGPRASPSNSPQAQRASPSGSGSAYSPNNQTTNNRSSPARGSTSNSPAASRSGGQATGSASNSAVNSNNNKSGAYSPSSSSPNAKAASPSTVAKLKLGGRNTGGEGSPVRAIGGAPLAPTSPESRMVDQGESSSTAAAAAAAAATAMDPDDFPEIPDEDFVADMVDARDDSDGEPKSTEILVQHHDNQFVIRIPHPLMLTSTIARGSYHQCGTARRVKVYQLSGETWQDRGTGYCAGVYDETQDQALLVARMEENCVKIDGALPDPRKCFGRLDPLLPMGMEGDNPEGRFNEDNLQPFILIVSPNLDVEEIMLKTRVVKEDVYQKQQDTLVVWTEPNGTDMALSFQEAEGCHEVWEFITEVQNHFHQNSAIPVDALSDPPTPDPGSPISGDFSVSGLGMGGVPITDATFSLPEPDLYNLDQIDQLLRVAATKGPQAREKVAEWLVRADYVSKLLECFLDAEDMKNLDALHELCTIMQTIVMLNDSAIVEYLLRDDLFSEAVGMFEYDPEFPLLKASYRDHFRHTAKYKQVVPFDDPKIVTKIHQVYQLQYLKDVILARILDDAMFSVLNSWMFFHQSDIVAYCSTHETFLKRVFAVCASDSQEATEKKHDAVFFLQQLCAMGKQIQLPSRIGLYRTLTETGLLNVLQFALFEPVARVRNAGAEMLMIVVEYDPNSVRNHILMQVERGERTLVAMLSDLLRDIEDLGLKAQVTDAIRILFDTGPENAPPNTGMAAAAAAARTKGDPDLFLTWLYESDIRHLFSPLKELPSISECDSNTRLDLFPRHKSALIAHLCELLCYAVAQHTFRSQHFVITSEIGAHIATLLHAKEKHMQLAAVKFFRSCLACNNQFTIRHFIKRDIFGAILTLTERESIRDTLVLSACLELVELIKREKMRPIMAHLMERYKPRLNHLAEQKLTGGCFGNLILSMQAMEAKAEGDSGRNAEGSRRRLPRPLIRQLGGGQVTMDLEEESYFNEDDDDEIEDTPQLRLGRQSKSSSLSRAASMKNAAGQRAPGSDSDSDSDSDSLMLYIAPEQSYLGDQLDQNRFEGFEEEGASTSATGAGRASSSSSSSTGLGGIALYDSDDDDAAGNPDQSAGSTGSPSSAPLAGALKVSAGRGEEEDDDAESSAFTSFGAGAANGKGKGKGKAGSGAGGKRRRPDDEDEDAQPGGFFRLDSDASTDAADADAKQGLPGATGNRSELNRSLGNKQSRKKISLGLSASTSKKMAAAGASGSAPMERSGSDTGGPLPTSQAPESASVTASSPSDPAASSPPSSSSETTEGASSQATTAAEAEEGKTAVAEDAKEAE